MKEIKLKEGETLKIIGEDGFIIVTNFRGMILNRVDSEREREVKGGLKE